MSFITNAIRLDREYSQLLDTIKKEFLSHKPYPVAISGLCDGASDAFLVSLVEDTRAQRRGEPLFILCHEEKECLRLQKMLSQYGICASFYLNRDLNFYNITASHEYEHERLKVLFEIINRDVDVILTTPDAALSYTVPMQRLKENLIKIDTNTILEPQELCRRLTCAGYTCVDMIDGAGQFAHRGGIVDIYSAGGFYIDESGERVRADLPVRIEFFGDEIDRMGLFSVETQRMQESVECMEIPPAREILTCPDDLARLREAVSEQLKSTKNPDAFVELSGELTSIDGLKNEVGSLKFIDKYITLIYPERCCLFDYIEERTCVIVKGTNAIAERLRGAQWHDNQVIEELIEGGTIAPKYTDYSKPVTNYELFCDRNVTLHTDSIMQGLSGKNTSGAFYFRTKQTVSYDEKTDLLFEDIEQYLSGNFAVGVLCENEVFAKNICGLLEERGISATIEPDEISHGEVGLYFKKQFFGYELTSARFCLLSTDKEGRNGGINSVSKSLRRKKKKSNTQAIFSYNDLEVGDLVVHEAYGIGRYAGIENLVQDGVGHDYITIQYAGSDKLFLPVEKLDMVSKYVGAHSDDGLIKLSRFGGAEWGRTKAKAKAAVKEMAKELIDLYARRMRMQGFAFPRDDDFQADFESAFEYDETDAQIEAINEIKGDMMQSMPMDRLLCGDVGFGKTEVAFRAAYKAVLGGKQVAILVPTTILALQHYQTAISRFRAFGVNVDMISRFKTAKQQGVTKRKLKRGEIDILIGTHRLISNDIEFRDLGLLIVDEEQRFGVAQKEKLKKLSGNIDVLSLSATPIPRTLNMAMGGLRDISVLDEAPIDRIPIQTYVLEQDDLIVNEAIRRELRRGGQVFYMHNFVDSIYAVAARLQRAFPDAKITVAHGKMEKDELEDIWGEMLKGEIDILVSTTIIETGIDIPNANTLIVDNAHRLGLSQLHQIRGRVGRSSRRAYAYFTYPKDMALTEIAQKRLEAVREYAEFGAGFKIAMRDLELRGAGNMLGAEQHGHLDAVGYDLYIKLLNEAVLEEKGEKVEQKPDCVVTLNYNAFIPEKYVSFSAQRMGLYKKIALIENEYDRLDIMDEMIDRYGDMPKPTQNLLMIALIRANALKCGIASITQDGGEFKITPNHIDIDLWSDVEEKFDGKMKIILSSKPYISMRPSKSADALKVLNRALENYVEFASQQQ